MGLHSVLFGSALDVVNDKFALVIDCGDIANAHWRGLERPGLDSELFLPFAQKFEAATIKLVDIEDTFGRWALTKETESGTLWYPLYIEGCEGQARCDVLDHLWRICCFHLNLKFLLNLITI